MARRRMRVADIKEILVQWEAGSSISGIAAGLKPGQQLNVHGRRADGSEFSFDVLCRIDTPIEIEYYRHGGILPYVLRLLLRSN